MINYRNGIALFSVVLSIFISTYGITQEHPDGDSYSVSKRSRPNVILIMTDDQGYGDIAAHGNPYLKTPALDQLYNESVRLTNFHTDPSCSPTRAALMTGQYSARSGVWHTIGGRSLLQKDKVTMADVFQFNGYRTGIFGKWHLGDSYPYRANDRGFQESVVHGGGVVGSNPDYWGNDYYDDTYYHNGKPEKYNGYSDRVWFNEAIRFIRENKQNPFFCYLATNIPHAPLRVDKKYSDPYRTGFDLSDRLANYYGMVTEFDEQLSRLLGEVRELGLAENTILVYMADNGPCPWFGGVTINNEGFVTSGYTKNMRGGKIWGYENAHREPCFIRWPDGGVYGGKDVDNLTAHFDLLPTLIEACQLKNPSNETFDGLSLLPLLNGQTHEWPERTVIVQNQRVDFPVKYKEYEVLTQRWRLIHPYLKELEDMEKFNLGIPDVEKPGIISDPALYELYDINTDPGEKNNLAGQYPDIIKKLSQEYENWWRRVSKDFDKYNNMIIGSEKANPTTLYAHDAHSKGNIRAWAIDVESEGKYRVTIRRWPREADKTIAENRDGKVIYNLSNAVLQIGNTNKSIHVTNESKGADFFIDLKSGETSLQGWFTDAENEKRVNAEYIYVERVGVPDPLAVKNYRASGLTPLLK